VIARLEIVTHSSLQISIKSTLQSRLEFFLVLKKYGRFRLARKADLKVSLSAIART
jgi:hypothetical protein